MNLRAAVGALPRTSRATFAALVEQECAQAGGVGALWPAPWHVAASHPTDAERARLEGRTGVELPSAPASQVGETTLLAVLGRATATPLLLRPTGPQPRLALVPLGADAMHAWRQSRTAVEWTVAYLVDPTPHDEKALVYRVGPHECVVATGSSFGLSFALARMSLRLGVPIPRGTVASATIDARGNLGPVEGLALKIGLLDSCLLGVDRCVVHASQAPAARALLAALALDERVEVVGVETLAEGVAFIWEALDQAVAARVQSTCVDSASRRLYELSFGSRLRFVRWEPMWKVANALRPHAHGVPLVRLAWVEAVARRHDGQEREALDALPDLEALFTLERRPEMRTRILAHLVQFDVDTGRTLAPELAERVRAIVRTVEGSSDELPMPHELHVVGAYARLLWVQGALDEGLRLSLLVADHWQEYRWSDPEAVAYPLSVAYVLAGLVRQGGPEAFATCETLASACRTYNPWVALGRTRSLLRFGRFEEAGAALDQLEEEVVHHADYLVASVARWRRRWRRAAGGAADEAHRPAVLGKEVVLADAQCALDRALDEGTAEDVRVALGWFARTRHAGLVERMRSRCPEGWGEAEWIADGLLY
jgi:hypothetical protein